MSYNKTLFDDILLTFENEDIKIFAQQCIDTIPTYFWTVPASSSKKYHGAAYVTEGGLARHTLALCRIMNHLFSIDCVKNQYTSRERDLLRIAGLMHDTRKSGSQEDYEKSKYTKFDHPLLASNEIARVWNDYSGKKMSIEEVKLIRSVIESHMGQFNTDKRHPDVVLPIPQDKYQIIVHICDYLASRKDIEIKFDEETKAELPDVNTWVLPFGKYKGMTLVEVQAENPGYIEWAKSNANSEPFRSLVMQL